MASPDGVGPRGLVLLGPTRQRRPTKRDQGAPGVAGRSVGDQLSFWALGRRMDAYRVGVLEPNRFLGPYGYSDLRGRWLDPKEARPTAYMEGIWASCSTSRPAAIRAW
jgi:hypothetical protein